jgi:hypothetical protein
MPVLVQPGMSDNTINIELGYGRTVSGDVAKDVGFNSNLMSKITISPYIYTGVSIKKRREI